MQKAKVVFADEKKEFLNKRRQLLKDKKMEEYNAVVIEMVKKEQVVGADLVQTAMEHIGLDENEFMETHKYYMLNPETL